MRPLTIIILNISLVVMLSGCSDNENAAVFEDTPNVSIEYVDKEGNQLKKTVDVKGLSVTNEKGESVINSLCETCLSFRIAESYSSNTPATERQYYIKYKILTHLGQESVEDFKLIFKIEDNAARSKFTKAWYNDDELSNFVTSEIVFSDVINLQKAPDEDLIERRKKELIYNGNRVAYIEGSSIYIVLPIEHLD